MLLQSQLVWAPAAGGNRPPLVVGRWPGTQEFWTSPSPAAGLAQLGSGQGAPSRPYSSFHAGARLGAAVLLAGASWAQRCAARECAAPAALDRAARKICSAKPRRAEESPDRARGPSDKDLGTPVAEIWSAELIQRSYYLSQCPPETPKYPEFAVFGKSNVGKSSLINLLCNRKLLSTISKHPGHTCLLHHFLINKSWYLVDLPGIGFAEGSRNKLQAMDRMVTAYVRHRTTLVEILYLVDGSAPPQQDDLDGIKWFTDMGVELCVVFTKTDQGMRGTVVGGVVEAFSKALYEMEGSPWKLNMSEDLPPMFLTSAKARTGRDMLLQHIVDSRSQYRPRKLARQSEGKSKMSAEKEAVSVGPPPAIR